MQHVINSPKAHAWHSHRNNLHNGSSGTRSKRAETQAAAVSSKAKGQPHAAAHSTEPQAQLGNSLPADLQAEKLGLLVLGRLQDCVHPRPRLWVLLQQSSSSAVGSQVCISATTASGHVRWAEVHRSNVSGGNTASQSNGSASCVIYDTAKLQESRSSRTQQRPHLELLKHRFGGHALQAGWGDARRQHTNSVSSGSSTAHSALACRSYHCSRQRYFRQAPPSPPPPLAGGGSWGRPRSDQRMLAACALREGVTGRQPGPPGRLQRVAHLLVAAGVEAGDARIQQLNIEGLAKVQQLGRHGLWPCRQPVRRRRHRALPAGCRTLLAIRTLRRAWQGARGEAGPCSRVAGRSAAQARRLAGSSQRSVMPVR